jgi:hypothetical protein
MIDRELIKNKLIERFSEIDLANKYYGYYEKNKVNEGVVLTGRDEIKEKIKKLPVAFKYDKKDKFYYFEGESGGLEYRIKIAVLYDNYLELIYGIKHEGEYVGGVLTGFAREVARLKDKDFQYDPRSPKIPFSTPDQLEDALNFSFQLFQDMTKVLVDHPLEI